MSATKEELLASLVDEIRLGCVYELYTRAYLSKDELIQLISDIIEEF